jgi:CheY-like chemotaxis protein
MLERHGHHVDIAADGQAAVEAAAGTDYDAILMDCQMPVLDGFEATRAIRRNEEAGRRTPIIALTAGAMTGDAEACLAAGMDDYITKPVNTDDLNATLRKWLSPSGDPSPTRQAVATPPASELDEEIVGQLAELSTADDGVAALIAGFVASAPARIAELRNAVDSNDVDRLRSISHSLRGSSGSLAATRVASLLANLEASVTTDGLDAATEHVDAVEAALLAACAALTHHFPQPQPSDAAP